MPGGRETAHRGKIHIVDPGLVHFLGNRCGLRAGQCIYVEEKRARLQHLARGKRRVFRLDAGNDAEHRPRIGEF